MDNFFFSAINPVLFLGLLVWLFVWKGIALWRAANNSHKKWFVILLVLNTLGLLEIIYFLFFSKKKENSAEK